MKTKIKQFIELFTDRNGTHKNCNAYRFRFRDLLAVFESKDICINEAVAENKKNHGHEYMKV